jgi:hypothetical protein
VWETVRPAPDDAPTSLRDQLGDRLVQDRRAGHRVDERHVPVPVDQIRRIDGAAVHLMHGPAQLINENRPGDRLDVVERLGIVQLLLVAPVGRFRGNRVRLADDERQELDPVAPTGVELLERLDRADRERSGGGGEEEEDRLSPPAAQPQRAAVGAGQVELRCRLIRNRMDSYPPGAGSANPIWYLTCVQ